MVDGRDGDARLAAWWKLVAAHGRLAQQVGRDLVAATALQLSAYNVLRVLQDSPGYRLRLGELAAALLLTPSGATRVVRRLERAGLLRREGHAKDGRGAYAVMTDPGRKEWRRARVAFARIVAKHFASHLTDAEAEALNAILGRFVAAETGGDFQ
jgi:DNA-binding MarR family transcriptional regulator